jgi:hypothetical protein
MCGTTAASDTVLLRIASAKVRVIKLVSRFNGTAERCDREYRNSYRTGCGRILLAMRLSANDPGCVKTLIERIQMGIVFSGINELEVVLANTCYAIRHLEKDRLCAASAPALLHGQDSKRTS